MSRRRTSLLAAGAVLLLVGCGDDLGSTGSEERFPIVVQQSDDPTIPYGITAIDYHFHDAHPSLPLSSTRTVKFVNDGRVRHNVTFTQFGFSGDLRPGAVLEIRDLGERLGGPGTYPFFCAYHAAMGMVGTIVIEAG